VAKLPGWAELDPQDVAAVRQVVEDYFLGWFDGDPDRMRRALHPDLVKRSHRSLDGSSLALTSIGTAQQMIDLTAAGQGRLADADERRFEVVVDDIHGSIATARVNSVPFREYVHLVRTPEGWRIVDALWTWTDPGLVRPGG